MNYYLIDYENVKVDGLKGISKLSEEDIVCIFYSENADSMTFGLHRRLNESKAKLIYRKVEVGNKNALDFQLSSYLGYIIKENIDNPYEYYVVSADKGYECLVNFWKKYASIKTVDSIAGQNENIIEEDLSVQVQKLLGEKEKDIVKDVTAMIKKYKTKVGLNNAMTKKYKDGKRVSNILTAIKPLIADKKGN